MGFVAVLRTVRRNSQGMQLGTPLLASRQNFRPRDVGTFRGPYPRLPHLHHSRLLWSTRLEALILGKVPWRAAASSRWNSEVAREHRMPATCALYSHCLYTSWRTMFDGPRQFIVYGLYDGMILFLPNKGPCWWCRMMTNCTNVTSP
jgi:hypothetical protein